MDYPLEQLGPERFQQICQALMVKEFPRVQCFPIAQPDGGRDAISYVLDSPEGKFVIFQVKYARKPLAETEPHKWLAGIIDEELPKITKLIPRGASRFCLLTNVPGTAHLDVGSMDIVDAILTKVGIPASCWWRDDINRRLDSAWDIKWAYPEVMRGTDFLRAIIESGLNENIERRNSTLRAFLRTQYDGDEEVRFKQVELQNKLLDLFIDVPISLRDPHAERPQYYIFHRIVADTRSRSEPELEEVDIDVPFTMEVRTGYISGGYVRGDEQAGAATVLLSRSMQRNMPHVVVEGAPGQGKSTISQYVCQVHRMRLLDEQDAIRDIKPEHAASPLRFPIKVDLRDFATWLSKRDPFNFEETTVPANWSKSLESFLAALISFYSGGTLFSVDDLIAIMRISSVLLVFDGLDEVADMTRRAEVVDEIERAVQRLEENAASLQVIVTSRPAAFANSPGMPHRRFPHLTLASLSRPLILEYADRWLRARRLDSKQAAEFRSVLKEKLDQPHLRDLARNPMQLAILLSLIHTRGTSLPDKRTALYDYYIDLFFSRESAKSSVVRDNRDLLINIHRYLAWLLHSEAEQGSSSASISVDRLQKTVTEYLVRQGHDPSLTEELFKGMVERVVALVSRVEGTFEFEVQPLREYFAACHLYYTAPQSSPGKEQMGSKPDRFDAICRNFYWLNVTRFYAGCYSKGELPSLVDRFEELLRTPGFDLIDYPRSLVATLLGDWVFTQTPKSIQKIVTLAFETKGLRYVLASQRTRRLRSSVSPIQLPPKCGRDELIQKCFHLLNEDVGADFALQLVDVIKSNSENEPYLKDEWLKRITAASPDRRLLWLDFGRGLEVLPTLDLATLDALMKDLELDSDRRAVSILIRAGRTDFLESSEARFNLAVDAILSRAASATPQRRVESALHALSHSVDASRYSIAFQDRQPRSLSEVAEARHRVAKLTWPDQLTTLSEGYEAHAKCVALARVAEQESKRASLEWATDLSPWEQLIELGREFWGDQWCFVTLANIAAGVRSNSEQCSEFQELFDSSVSLVRRVRYARLRSGNAKWWKRQFEAIKTNSDLRLCLLVAMTWTMTSTLLELLDPISELLKSLDPWSWYSVFNEAQRAKRLTRQRQEPFDKEEAEHLPSQLDNRFVSLLMLRANPAGARVLYERYLKECPLADPVIRNFIYTEALDLERFGLADWKPNLEQIEECYKKGENFEPHSYRYASGSEDGTMPIAIAIDIAKRPTSFPSFLVAAAVERIRADVKSKVVPVAKTAEHETWFANE